MSCDENYTFAVIRSHQLAISRQSDISSQLGSESGAPVPNHISKREDLSSTFPVICNHQLAISRQHLFKVGFWIRSFTVSNCWLHHSQGPNSPPFALKHGMSILYWMHLNLKHAHQENKASKLLQHKHEFGSKFQSNWAYVLKRREDGDRDGTGVDFV